MDDIRHADHDVVDEKDLSPYTGLIQMKTTPGSVRMLANYSRTMNMMTGVTASLRLGSSTKLKIQSNLDRPRSTCLTVYGTGSMQFADSPDEIAVLYPSLMILVKTVMDSEMVGVLKTIKMADKKSI